MPKPITTTSLKLLCILCVCRITVYAQQDTTSPKNRVDQAITVSDKSSKYIDDKYSKLTTSVDKQTAKMLSRMQQNEEKLRHKLALKDSTKAATCLAIPKRPINTTWLEIHYLLFLLRFSSF